LKELVKMAPTHEGVNQYYWVFTQDPDLQHSLNEIEHVPVGYMQIKGNTLTLLEPNENARAKTESKEKFLPSAHEYRAIAPIRREERKKQMQKSLERARKERTELQMKLKKPAAGPNPLSSKKK
jgi:U3 small nucleolar RNA-associated protein 23